MSSQENLKITARRYSPAHTRIAQGDIFSDIEIIEDVYVEGDEIKVKKLIFPYVVCLSQECDLESDFSAPEGKTSHLLHIAIAPAFNFEHFLTGNHWGEIPMTSESGKRKDTKIKIIMDNDYPRYHYLKFPEGHMPELIVDFKHFFTINRDYLYNHIDKRFCSIDNLFKERISQRFSNYLSRIGLPEVEP